jgi:hypothetical protein
MTKRHTILILPLLVSVVSGVSLDSHSAVGGQQQPAIPTTVQDQNPRQPVTAAVPVFDPPPAIAVDKASHRRPTVADPTASVSLFELLSHNTSYRNCAEDSQRPKGLADLDGGYSIFHYSLAEDSAIQLSFIQAGAATRTKRSVVQVFRVMQYVERTCDIGGVPTPVIWGVGAEAVLHVRNAKRGIDLSKLSVVAAAVELNRAEVTFSMNTPGVTGSAVREVLPDAGSFNVDNYVKVVGAIDQVRLLLDDPTVTIRPQLLRPLSELPAREH